MEADAPQSPGRRLLWVTTSVALAVLVGALDVATGPELSFSLFYLAAVSLAVWRGGPAAGLALAGISAAIWLVADRAAGGSYSASFIPYWNALIRLGFFVIVALLLAAQHRALARERSLARFDPLTGALNRRRFLERLGEERERSERYGRPLTLAYLDLDNFKQVNDAEGHAAGDRVLSAVAGHLLRRLRRTDSLARVGGDEFALLLPETNGDAARITLDSILPDLAELMRQRGWPVTFSIGVVTATNGGIGADELVRAADELMYRVKREGKNGALYTSVNG